MYDRITGCQYNSYLSEQIQQAGEESTPAEPFGNFQPIEGETNETSLHELWCKQLQSRLLRYAQNASFSHLEFPKEERAS
jgi:hypothetical protein